MLTDIFKFFASILLLTLEAVINYPAYSLPSLGFIALALYWRETGRFPVIGLIVRLFYLPFNLLAGVLWLVTVPLIWLVGILDYFPVFKGAVIIVSFLLCWQNPVFILFTAGLILLLTGRVNTEAIKAKISYYPQAKREPAPRLARARPTPVAKPPKQQKAPAHSPPPLVTIATAYYGMAYGRNELIAELPPHLQALIAGSRKEEPSPKSQGRSQGLRLVKLVLRSLLLLPLWLLLLPVRGARAMFGKKPQPLTEKAGSNE